MDESGVGWVVFMEQSAPLFTDSAEEVKKLVASATEEGREFHIYKKHVPKVRVVVDVEL